MSAGAEQPRGGSAAASQPTAPVRELGLVPLAAAVALLLALGVPLALGLGPRGLLAVPAAALLLGPALWAPLALLSGTRPSWIKLGLLGWLLGPPAALVPWLLLRAGPLGGEGAGDVALAVLFGVFALLHVALLPAARGRTVRRERPGAATVLALVLSAGMTALVAAFLFQGSAPRVSYHGLLHSGLLLATERNLPPSNPWMADAPLGYYWIWHALGALFARAFALAPTQALCALNLWAVAALAPTLQLLAAVLWRGRGRELAAVVGGLFSLGTASALVWLVRGAEVGEPNTALGLFAELARGVPDGADGLPLFDRRLSYGLSKFGNSNSYPASLALVLGAWFAAAHALRHGVRPWPLLTGALHGAAALLNPLVGLVGAGPTLCAAVFAGTPAARINTALATVLALVPGALATMQASAAFGGESVQLEPSAGGLGVGMLPLVLVLPLALFGLVQGVPGAGWRGGEPRRAVLVLLAVAALGPLVLHGLVILPYDNQYKLVRLAAIPVGMLAGAGCVGWFVRGRAARVAAVVCGGSLLALAAANEWRGGRAYLAFARVEAPLVEEPLSLSPGPATSASADLAAAYRFLRTESRLREHRPVLLLDAFESTGYGYGEPPRAFVTPDNLQGHEAAVFAAMDLYFDRPSQVLDARTPGLAARRTGATQLLRDRSDWSPEHRRALWELGRPVVVLLGPRDVDRLPSVVHRLRSSGFAQLWSEGSVALYIYPAELAPQGEEGETR